MLPRSPLLARYPPTGAWPAAMHADVVAAYLDCRDTSELARGVGRAEATPPMGYQESNDRWLIEIAADRLSEWLSRGLLSFESLVGAKVRTWAR